jgi:hypothetical protein
MDDFSTVGWIVLGIVVVLLIVVYAYSVWRDIQKYGP